MSRGLSKQQQAIIAVLANAHAELMIAQEIAAKVHGVMPDRAFLCPAFDCGTLTSQYDIRSVRRALLSLEKRGLVERVIIQARVPRGQYVPDEVFRPFGAPRILDWHRVKTVAYGWRLATSKSDHVDVGTLIPWPKLSSSYSAAFGGRKGGAE